MIPHSLPLREPDVDSNVAYLPTAEQIAAECRRIQSEWSPDDKRRRRAGPTASPYWETQGHPETVNVVNQTEEDSDLF